MALTEQDREMIELKIDKSILEMGNELKDCIEAGIAKAIIGIEKNISTSIINHQNTCPLNKDVLKGKAFLAGMMAVASVVGSGITFLASGIVKKIWGL
jgi:hypothetical protein